MLWYAMLRYAMVRSKNIFVINLRNYKMEALRNLRKNTRENKAIF